MRLFNLIIATCLVFLPKLWGANGPPSCQTYLLPPRPHLGIGVLGHTLDGSDYLAISPYVASSHTELVDKLKENYSIESISWMGELRYYIDENDHIWILEANETSGLYATKSGDRLGVRIENHLHNLPEYIKSPSYRDAPHYHLYNHLADELNHVPGNVRHEFKNAFMVLSSLTRLLTRAQESDQLLERISKARMQLQLLLWMVNQLANDRMVEDHELAGTRTLLNHLIFHSRDAEFLRSLLSPELVGEFSLIHDALSGEGRFGTPRIQIYRL